MNRTNSHQDVDEEETRVIARPPVPKTCNTRKESYGGFHLFQLLENKNTFDDDKLRDICRKFPRVCEIPRDWEESHYLKRFYPNVLPLFRICKFQPSLELVKMVYESYPQAIYVVGSLRDYMLPLHVACRNKASSEVIEFLACCDFQTLQVRDSLGYLPLHHVCANGGSPNLIRFMVSNYPGSIRVNTVAGLLPIHEYTGTSPEVYSFLVSEYPESVKEFYGKQRRLALHNACFNGAPREVIQLLVSEYPDSIKEMSSSPIRDEFDNPMNDWGDLPLHRACMGKASFDVISFLVSAYPDGVKQETGRRYLPLQLACGYGASLETIQLLLLQYPDGIRHSNHKGLPLHMACRGGSSPQVVQFLISRYPQGVREKSFGESLPLHLACQQQGSSSSSTLEVVKLLVSEHRDGLKEKAQDMLPLHLACQSGASLEVICYLLTEYPEGIKEFGRSGWLPLHFACRNKETSVEVIQYLISKYSQGLEEGRGADGMPIHIASRNGGSIEVLHLLISKYRPGLHLKCSPDRALPLHHACKRGACLETIQYLVSEYQDSIKEKDGDGDLPLHVCCRNGASANVIQWLAMQYQRGLNTLNQDGDLPFHVACQMNAPSEIIGYLMPEYRNRLHLPLHNAFALSTPSLELIALIVSKYRDSLKEMSRNGRLPLHDACCCRECIEVVRFMVSEYPDAIKKQTGSPHQLPVHICCKSYCLPHFDVLGLLISEYPECLHLHNLNNRHFEDDSIRQHWRLEQELQWDHQTSRSFTWLEHRHQYTRVGVIGCLDGEAASMIAETIQQELVHWMIIVGCGLSGLIMSPITMALQANQTLTCLGLGKNPIGDSGIRLLATALQTNKTLKNLDVRGCSIGMDGLLALLGALEENNVLTNLDLSYNTGIFNVHGGKEIVSFLDKRTTNDPCLEQLYVYREDEYPGSFEFVEELVSMLQWKPPLKKWPVSLNRLDVCVWQAIAHYVGLLHKHVLFMDPSARLILCHYILERVRMTSQNNAESVFFYVRAMLE